MKIAIGSDHAGLDVKNLLRDYLIEEGYEVTDVGTYTHERCDYPVFAHKVCECITSGEVERGILVCGTGIGMSMAANKKKGIRAAVCSDDYSTEFTRRHNDANILCLGARVIGIEIAKRLCDRFLTTGFDGAQHQGRIDMYEAE